MGARRAGRGCVTAALALALIAPTVTQASARTVRVAVVIGNNRGHDAGRTLRYAEQDARKVHRVLTELGGVRADNAFLLTGSSATEVWSKLRGAERRVRQHEREPGTRTVLTVYYSGHADGEGLELGQTELPFTRLVRFLRSSRADVRIAFVDSCRSGRLLAAKGGRRGARYRIQVNDEVASRGYALITSSADNELSQESSEIRGSFFTHYLVSALRGAGDLSGDGEITLGEAYRYTYRRTVARTSTTIGGSQHPMYDFKLAGRGEIVITSTRSQRAGLTVQARGRRVVVTDGDGRTMVAEGQAAAGRPVRLALPPGRYLVYLMSGARVRRAAVSLALGQQRVLRTRAFSRQPLSRAVAKGGLFKRSWSHVLSGGLLVRRMPLEASGFALGAVLQYGLELHSSWQVVARLGWSSASDSGLSTGYNDVGAHGGVLYRWHDLPTPLSAGLMLGYEHMLQDERDGDRRHTSALSYLGTLGVELPVGPAALYVTGAVGGRVFRLRAEGAVHRFDLQLTTGLGWRWGKP